MRVLVTGAAGFAGSHLVERLTHEGHDVWGMIRPQETPAVKIPQLLMGDLLDLQSLHDAFEAAQPDVVFHLAGQADVGLSWKLPVLTMQVNTIGTINLLEALIAFGRPRLIAITSADVYGPLPLEAMPINGYSTPKPYHPYAVSKLAASDFLTLYHQRYHLDIIEARPFNHIGPRQGLGFVAPDFASQVAAIMLGRDSPNIKVGNLSAERDFTDVRDVIRAYTMLAENGTPGHMYLVCSGRPIPVDQILNILIKRSGMEIQIEHDPARMRPSDTPCLYGSNDKMRRDVGWQPEIPLETSLQEVLEEWLLKLRTDE